MPRDETRDCYVLFRLGQPLRCYPADVSEIESNCGSDEAWLMSPHSQLVDLERQLADRDDAIRQLQEAMNDLRIDSAKLSQLRNSVSEAVTFLERRVEAFEGSGSTYQQHKAIGINEALLVLRRALEPKP